MDLLPTARHAFVPLAIEQQEAAAPKKVNPWAPVAITARGMPWGEFGLNQAVRRAAERAKLDGWSFDDLPHFFVTELFRNGASAVAIQQVIAALRGRG